MSSREPDDINETVTTPAPDVSEPEEGDIAALPRRKQPESGTPTTIGRPDDQPYDSGPPSTGRRRPLLLQNHHFRDRGAASPPVA
jgi:hypothetical protein